MGEIRVTIIEELSESRYILECSTCGGSGEMSRDHDNRGPYVTCSVCGGKGKVMVKLSGSTPFVECALCDGSGEMSRDHDGRGPYVICEGCQGVGAQPMAGEMEILD
jgi:DnaJ-class molecular chaperone